MKFLNEVYDNNLLVEEKLDEVSGKKSLYVTGPFMSYDKPNRNGRIYKKESLVKEAMRFKKEVIDEGLAWSEMSHPDSLTISPDRICARIVDIWDDPSQSAIMGKAVVTEGTPMGALLKGLIESKGKIGISTRGAGTLKKNSAGLNEVQDDFRLVTADIVLSPSGINCFVSPVMESKEFALVDGQILEVNEATEQAILAKHGVKSEKIEETSPTPTKSQNLDKVLTKLKENAILSSVAQLGDKNARIKHLEGKLKHHEENFNKLKKALQKSVFNIGEIHHTWMPEHQDALMDHVRDMSHHASEHYHISNTLNSLKSQDK